MNKKKAAVIISVLAAAAFAVGATLAYLNDTTETVTNTFASSKDISIKLRESAWDGYDFNTDDADYPLGQHAKDAADETLGFNQAHDYVPGQVIPKDPTVKNTGTEGKSVNAYVALKVKYFDAEGNQVSYEDFKKLYLEEPGITFDSSWKSTANGGKDQIYVYGNSSDSTAKVLAVGKETPPLFAGVPLSYDLEPGKDGTLPQFKIEVTAYAIQENEISGDMAADKLLEFINK